MNDCHFCQRISAWLSKPYDEDGDALNWFLFVGFVAIISWLWSRILARIIPAA